MSFIFYIKWIKNFIVYDFFMILIRGNRNDFWRKTGNVKKIRISFIIIINSLLLILTYDMIFFVITKEIYNYIFKCESFSKQ